MCNYVNEYTGEQNEILSVLRYKSRHETENDGVLNQSEQTIPDTWPILGLEDII